MCHLTKDPSRSGVSLKRTLPRYGSFMNQQHQTTSRPHFHTHTLSHHSRVHPQNQRLKFEFDWNGKRGTVEVGMESAGHSYTGQWSYRALQHQEPFKPSWVARLRRGVPSARSVGSCVTALRSRSCSGRGRHETHAGGC